MVMKHSLISRSCKQVIFDHPEQLDLAELMFARSTSTAAVLADEFCDDFCADDGAGKVKDEV